MKRECVWNPDVLEGLKKQAGLSTEKLAEASGVSISSLNSYLSGRSQPSIESVMRLADFFAVPMDYLLGRCSEETANLLRDHYSEVFMALRKAPYEAYLTGRNDTMRWKIGDTVEAPWPYNLLDAINGERWDTPLNDDQMDGLDHAISFLNERARSHIYSYYRDGKTLEQVARMHGITRERTRQIITKAVHSMRHPVRMRFVKWGLHGAEMCDEYNDRLQRINAEMKRLDDMELELKYRREALISRPSEMEAVLPHNGGASIIDMDLTVRSYNCLERAGARTIADVANIARTGQLANVRNLGRKSMREILDKLKLFTDEDFDYLYPNLKTYYEARR